MWVKHGVMYASGCCGIFGTLKKVAHCAFIRLCANTAKTLLILEKLQ